MESTGKYWIPIFNILEDDFKVTIANPKYIKAVKGKKKSIRVSRASVYLKPTLVQCANAAIKSTKEPYFRNKYLKIKKRRGHKKAIIAIAHMMLTCIYHMFQTGEIFNPIDINYSDIPNEVLKSKRQQIMENAIKTLFKLGIDTSIINLIPANN